MSSLALFNAESGYEVIFCQKLVMLSDSNLKEMAKAGTYQYGKF